MIINPIWFYLINVADTLKTAFYIIGPVLIFIAGISTGVTIDMVCNDEEAANTRKIAKKIAIVGIILLIIAILLPNKETSYTMLVASQVTTTNIELATNAVKECIDYIASVMK